MSDDLRLFLICNREIDLDAPGVTIIDRKGGKRTLVIDAEGMAHSVTTRLVTERRRQQALKGNLTEAAD